MPEPVEATAPGIGGSPAPPVASTSTIANITHSSTSSSAGFHPTMSPSSRPLPLPVSPQGRTKLAGMPPLSPNLRGPPAPPIIPYSPMMALPHLPAGTSSYNNGRLRSRSFGNPPFGFGPGSPTKPVRGLSSPVRIHNGSGDLDDDGSGPPKISEQQRAMEAAVQKERMRAKQMEQEEAHLNADEVRVILKRERHRMARLVADLAVMRSINVQSVAEAEINEEGRVNCLMRRLDCLQQEKGRIIVELEREEEMLTNNLQKKLNEVRREKDALEKQRMSRAELEARLAKLQKGAEDIDMSEALEEKEEMEEE